MIQQLSESNSSLGIKTLYWPLSPTLDSPYRSIDLMLSRLLHIFIQLDHNGLIDMN